MAWIRRSCSLAALGGLVLAGCAPLNQSVSPGATDLPIYAEAQAALDAEAAGETPATTDDTASATGNSFMNRNLAESRAIEVANAEGDTASQYSTAPGDGAYALNNSHDRMAWPKTVIAVPIRQVQAKPSYDLWWPISTESPRSVGAYPTVDDALLVNHATGDDAAEAFVNDLLGMVAVVAVPFRWIGGELPWTVQRNPHFDHEQWERLPMAHEPGDPTRWFDAAAPPDSPFGEAIEDDSASP